MSIPSALPFFRNLNGIFFPIFGKHSSRRKEPLTGGRTPPLRGGKRKTAHARFFRRAASFFPPASRREHTKAKRPMPGGISPRTSRVRRRRRRKQFLMRVRTFLFRASSCGRERPPFPQELPPHPLREQILLRPPERTSFRNVCKKYTLPAFINCKRFVKKKLNPAFFVLLSGSFANTESVWGTFYPLFTKGLRIFPTRAA